ncbi:hypothetical protein N7492_000683 [Penicillium capsulatum]|uniref:Metallo-beta-lactamase domain-containing protein n=1 Tax=Penicillium capsulatum TaxID=69766 RepID=A0A9W9M0C3_9EURO|nr:hypothetical protein N7492_000683 [Penicillium capsulatum]KAJ6130259.1 hypothetical protein N7512_003039 [Penicillium capsulatum]
MCRPTLCHELGSAGVEAPNSLPSSNFEFLQITPSVFRLIESDQFGDNPFIYIKIYAEVIVVVDTGCNAPRQNNAEQISTLRGFLETTPIPENENRPLNPEHSLPYLILLSHCHYDHIRGLAHFRDAENAVVAAGARLGSDIILPGYPPDSIAILDNADRVVFFLGGSAYETGWLFYAYGSDLLLHGESLRMVETILHENTTHEEQAP